jgi:dynein heavy chain 2
LSIPQKFKGVNETLQENSIFAVIVERNANRFDSVYTKAEQLFAKLAGIEDQFKVSPYA